MGRWVPHFVADRRAKTRTPPKAVMLCQGRGLGNPHVRVFGATVRGAPLGKHRAAPEVPPALKAHRTHVPWKPAALLLTGHYAQAPAVLYHSRTLPQGDGYAGPAFAGGSERGERDLIVLDASDVLYNAFAVRCPSIDAEGKVSSQRAHLRPLLPHLLRTSRNSLGPLRSRPLRRCRSSSVADGSLRRSISWPAIARAFLALSVRTPPRRTLGPCSVAMTDLHSLQTMSAASWSFLSFAFITSNIIGCVLLHVGHQPRENRASTSMFYLQSSSASRFTAGAAGFFILGQSRSGPSRKATVSTPRCVGCKRVIWIAGIHKIRTRGAQHFFDLLDRLPNHAARLAGLNLASQLKEPPLGDVETLGQYGCHAKERDRVYSKYGGRIGDMKLRGFKRTYIGRVGLIQQHGEFAEHGARLRHPGDLNAFLYDRDRALLKDQQSAGCRGGAEHGLTGLVSGERKGGEPPLENRHIGNQGRWHVRSSVVVAGRHSKTDGSLINFCWEARRDEPGREGTLQHGNHIRLANHNCNFYRLKARVLLPRLRS